MSLLSLCKGFNYSRRKTNLIFGDQRSLLVEGDGVVGKPYQQTRRVGNDPEN